MTKGNVIRLMDEKDLPYVPEIRERFEEYGHLSDYFFFVIEDGDVNNKEVIGYLFAVRQNEKAIIKQLYLPKEFEKKEEYRNTAISNFYEYVSKIKGKEGKRIFFQVSFI